MSSGNSYHSIGEIIDLNRAGIVPANVKHKYRCSVHLKQSGLCCQEARHVYSVSRALNFIFIILFLIYFIYLGGAPMHLQEGLREGH